MIIGVVGPFCSGKDSIGEILAEKGFEVISTPGFLRKEMKEKGIELTRKNLQEYVRGMRKEVGLAYPSNKLVSEIKEGKNYVIQGLRNDEEGKELKKLKDFYLITIDAPERIRFERMKQRSREKDPVTYEEFKKIEDMELYGKGPGGYGFNIKACMEMADETITNDGSLEELREKVEGLLVELKYNKV